MMPQVKKAHDAQQDELNKLKQLVSDVDKTKKDDLDEAAKLKPAYEEKSGPHKECRGTEASLYAANIQCHTTWKAEKEQKELLCAQFEMMGSSFADYIKNRQIMKKVSGEESGPYIQRVSAVICGKNDGKSG